VSICFYLSGVINLGHVLFDDYEILFITYAVLSEVVTQNCDSKLG